MGKSDRILGSVLCLLSIVIYYLSTKFVVGFVIDSGLGADFFPKAISVILFLLSMILIIKSDKKRDEEAIFTKESLIVGKVVIGFLAYLVGMSIMGYLPATIAFLIGMFKFLKVKSNKLIFIYSICFSIFIWYIFGSIFNISLPQGIWV